MLIREPGMVRVEVTLKALLRLPCKPRREHGLRTVCDACGLEIEEDSFLGGFADGHKNMLFHESCVPAEERERLLKQ
jgi:hypothetical protein